MATEIETLRGQLTSMESAQLSGVLSVRFEDQQVTYRSADDMIKMMEYLRRRIRELENASANRSRYSVARFSCR